MSYLMKSRSAVTTIRTCENRYTPVSKGPYRRSVLPLYFVLCAVLDVTQALRLSVVSTRTVYSSYFFSVYCFVAISLVLALRKKRKQRS